MIEDIIKAVASKLDWILENYSSDESDYEIRCKVSGSGKEVGICRSNYNSICTIFPDDDDWDLQIAYGLDYWDDLKGLTLDAVQTILKSDTFEIRYPED